MENWLSPIVKATPATERVVTGIAVEATIAETPPVGIRGQSYNAGLLVITVPLAKVIPVTRGAIVLLVGNSFVNFFEHLSPVGIPAMKMVELEVEVVAKLMVAMAVAVAMVLRTREGFVEKGFSQRVVVGCR